MLMTVGFPNLYANDKDCCDSPGAQNRDVSDNLSPAEMASRTFVDYFVINGLTCFLDGQIAQETLGYTLNLIKTFIENDHSKTI